MPNRILHEGLRDSERMSTLSDGAFRTYVLLLTLADDFGRYHADNRLVRAGCYPFEQYTSAKVGTFLDELVSAGAILVYMATDGRKYLSIDKWNQRTRAQKSKFPSPDDSVPTNDRQPSDKGQSSAHGDGDGDGDVFEDGKPTFSFDDWFESAWAAYGRYGVKKKARQYARGYTEAELLRISKAIPVYLKCVATGRAKSQFEGWVNPANRKWDVDWIDALAQLQRPAVRPAPASNGSDYQVVT